MSLNTFNKEICQELRQMISIAKYAPTKSSESKIYKGMGFSDLYFYGGSTGGLATTRKLKIATTHPVYTSIGSTGYQFFDGTGLSADTSSSLLIHKCVKPFFLFETLFDSFKDRVGKS